MATDPGKKKTPLSTFTVVSIHVDIQCRVDSKRSTLILSQSVVGDVTMVGDKGFDPLGFVDSKEKLFGVQVRTLVHACYFLDLPLADMQGMKSLLVATPEGLAQLLKGMSSLVAG
jgi:hypothetical protein